MRFWFYFQAACLLLAGVMCLTHNLEEVGWILLVGSGLSAALASSKEMD